MLVYGPPGTSKTDTARWYALAHDMPYVRAKKITSARSLLSNIVTALEIAPEFRTEALFSQAVESLIDNPKPVFIDEIDYLIRDEMVEILRDLNDITNVPIIMFGMHQADKKLRRFPHLFDRFTSIVPFQLLTEEEIADLARQLCEVPIEADGIKYILSLGLGKIRLTLTLFARAERLAKHNKLDVITAKLLNRASNGGPA